VRKGIWSEVYSASPIDLWRRNLQRSYLEVMASRLYGPGGGEYRDPKQRWMTFVRNHAKAVVACDFFVVVTARFRILYVFVIMELATRRILHHNVTAHPTSEWTLQQFREALPGDHPYRFLIHDRDSIFSRELDKEVTGMGVRVLRTPVRSPKANSLCERFGGTLRRECLD
jgi:putative transposase